MPSILLVGATGLLGAPLTREIRLLYPTWSITVYIRNPAFDEYFKSKIGVNAIVHGSFEDTDKIQALAKARGVVVNAGASFDPTLSAALVAGLKERHEGCKGILIHISGVGNFIDNGTKGVANPDGKFWSDSNEDDIKQIDEHMLNGAADKLILEAGNSGAINTFIVCLGGTYGASSGPVPALGVLYKILVSNSKACGFVPYVGEGSNIFWTASGNTTDANHQPSSVHVNDGVRFILKVLHSAITQPVTGSAYSRYFIAASQSNTWKDIASTLAPVLHEKGALASPDPKSVPIEQAGEGEVPLLIGANVLVKGDRAATWGFKSIERSFLEHIRQDLALQEL